MAINELIARGGGVKPVNEAENALMAQRVAQGDAQLKEYEAQAPRRKQAEQVEDSDNKMAFLKDRISLVNDQIGLQAMRDEAVSIWGQTADDNMPTTYDQAQFDDMRSRLGVSSKEKYTTSSLVYDDQGNAYQPGSKGGLNRVELPGGGQLGLAPKDRMSYIKEKVKATTQAKTQAQQDQPASVTEINEARDAMNMIDELSSEEFDLGAIYGKGERYYPDLIRKQSNVDMMAKKDLVIDSLNLMAAGKLKGQGQITENEREMLKRAATTLGNMDISGEAAKEEFARVRLKFAEVMERGVERKKRGVAVLPDGREVPEGQYREAPAHIPPVNKSGWKLMTDASGNQAYVSPTGEIEEL